jgi:1,4-alpha-glucan branching enzyme
MPRSKTHMKKLLDGRHRDPFAFLGPHSEDGETVTVRAYLPGAEEAYVVDGQKSHEMERLSERNFFAATYERPAETKKPYKLRVAYDSGTTLAFHDPYAFPHVLTEYDIYLMGEGTHYTKHEKLGAHVRTVNGVRGVHFALWAPNARGVGVVGNFNLWDGRRHPMRMVGASGIWELFVPGLSEGELYKYEIRTESTVLLKTDPYGFYAEIRPQTASIVWDLGGYAWKDRKWMKERQTRDWFSSPVSVYEVHLGSWARGEENSFLSYRELAHRLVEYCERMGHTHIEILPVMEHPLDASWGYQTLGYFSVTSRFGTPGDFMEFVDHCHQHNIGVILDWVPAHFPKDAHGLAHFDGTFLFEHEHPFQREHMDWGTHIFNYGRNEVASFLLNSALFWLEKYHIDGLRVDAVASMLYLDYSRKSGEWIPNKYGGNENLEAIEFLKKFNELCHTRYPGVLTIAEESTAWPMVTRPPYMGGLGFSLKWNMGWMHDVLTYFSYDPVHRKYHHHNLTFGLIYAFQENFVLVLSHDEVVHGKHSLLDKMPGDLWQKFANLRLLFGFMYAHPGKKMLFMGGEFGQWSEWNEAQNLDWHLLKYDPHWKLQEYLRDLNELLAAEPALHEADFDSSGFDWIDMSDADGGVVSFMRKAKDPSDYLVVVCNFTPVARSDYRVGVPEKAVFREIMNSDSQMYWGSNVGNAGWAVAEEHIVNQWPCSLRISLPPLGMLVFKPQRKTGGTGKQKGASSLEKTAGRPAGEAKGRPAVRKTSTSKEPQPRQSR